MERLSDSYYVEKIRGGDISCFAPLIERYSKQVFSLIVKIVENREDAEELAQDVFVKAYGSLSSFRGDSSFSTWIYRIAYNIAVSASRKKTPDFISVDEDAKYDIADEPEELLSGVSDMDVRIECLSCAMKQLLPEERAMITLFYNDDRSMDEIAVISGLTETNVKTKIFRIRKKLLMLIIAMEEK